MTVSHLADAEASLLREREALQSRLDRVNGLLGTMKAILSVPVAVDGDQIPAVVRDEYKGMKLSPAFESYLKRRRGFKIPLSRVVEDLLLGGAEIVTPGSKNTPQQNLKITIRNKPKLVSFEEDMKESDKTKRNWTVWLAETSDIPPKRRNRQIRKG